MSKSSKKAQKIRQREKHREEMLTPKNSYGIKDPTPYEAVKHIRKEYLKEEKKEWQTWI